MRCARVVGESSASRRKAALSSREISYKLTFCFSVKLEKLTRTSTREIILIDEIWFPSFPMIHLSDGNLSGLDEITVGSSVFQRESKKLIRAISRRIISRACFITTRVIRASYRQEFTRWKGEVINGPARATIRESYCLLEFHNATVATRATHLARNGSETRERCPPRA